MKFYGFNAHTFQKCYSYKQMGHTKRKKYDEEVERAIAGQLSSQLAGKIPNPKWGEEKPSKKAKVIPVEDDDVLGVLGVLGF